MRKVITKNKKLNQIWIYRILILLLASAGTFLFLSQNNDSINSATTLMQKQSTSENLQPGEKFILNWMVNPNGTLKTNLKPQETTIQHVTVGADSLSESLGLWMLYTVEKKDQQQFHQAYVLLQKYYLSEDGMVYWKSSNDDENISTNALVDDLRIIEALGKAAAIWDRQEYSETAIKISRSIQRNQIINNSFADFYDDKADHTSRLLTLSYLNPAALATMYELRVLNDQIYQSARQFLIKIPTRNNFYPKNFDIQTKTFHFDEEINLVDQLFIAYHQARMGYVNKEFLTFLKREFSSHGVLYGRYSRSSKTPTVNYESPALYGLSILYALEAGDEAFAKQLYYKMIPHQTLNPDRTYYGGFIDYSKEDTHIFDNLLPLLAERILFNEGVLQ